MALRRNDPAPLGRVLLLPGDGIGQEIMRECRRVMDWFAKRQGIAFETEEDLVGGSAYDRHGTPITDAAMARAHGGGCGAVRRGRRAEVRRPAVRAEARARRCCACARSSACSPTCAPPRCSTRWSTSSSLKPELVQGLDIMILRELTGGIYFGEPRGIETLPDGERRGVNTQVYTTGEIVRIARVGFELAQKRQGRLCSVEKANVMESGVLWREEVQKLHDAEYPDVELSHMYADNCAMQLVRQPKQFDVIVSDNLFGDILSDCAAMLTGSLGMLPSASLGAAGPDGKRKAMYEPVHGSAPDIAGQNAANPIAMLQSFSMMLRYSFDQDAAADLLDGAIAKVLASGLRTADIMQDGMAKVSTSTMGEAIVRELDKVA